MKHKSPNNPTKNGCDFCSEARADSIIITVVISTKKLGETTVKKGPYAVCFKHKEDIENNINSGLNLLDSAKAATLANSKNNNQNNNAEKIQRAAEKINVLEYTYEEIIKGEG